MTELLVAPYRDSDEQRVDEFYALLSTLPNLDWIAPNLEIADVAARLRAGHRLRTPDALQAEPPPYTSARPPSLRMTRSLSGSRRLKRWSWTGFSKARPVYGAKYPSISRITWVRPAT